MISQLAPLHVALLELGLEDMIPLPEAVTMPEVLDCTPRSEVVKNVSTALVDLLHLGLIQIWSGHWADEPTLMSTDLTEPALRDECRYSFAAEANGLDRVYYVNVENLRG